MLHNEAAHIKDELYDTFKTWAPEQHAKFFNASGGILEFIIKQMSISMIIAQGAMKEKIILPLTFREYIYVYSLKKPPWNYHPPDLMITLSNSKTCLCPNDPRLTHSTPSNIKPARSVLMNISRQGRFSLPNPPKQHHFSLSKRKKLGNYAPAKTISISIAIQSRMPIPSPSSPISLTNYKNHWSSPNLMYDGGTTMSSSSRRTIGRQPSPPTWAIQTKCYVLQNVQLTDHIPGLCGQSLWRLYRGGLAGNLYGWFADLLLGSGNTQWMDRESSSMLLRTGDVPQTGNVYILSQRTWNDSRKGGNTDGPS